MSECARAGRMRRGGGGVGVGVGVAPLPNADITVLVLASFPTEEFFDQVDMCSDFRLMWQSTHIQPHYK